VMSIVFFLFKPFFIVKKFFLHFGVEEHLANRMIPKSANYLEY
jgi:hypothetical protein